MGSLAHRLADRVYAVPHLPQLGPATVVAGWCTIIAFLLNSLVGAGFLLLIVERNRKCLDFTATVYIVHLFLSLIYGGLPSSVTWWLVNGICVAIMACVGEWLCIRRELREIPTRSSRASV
ncbi:hypothetical protein L7F22_014544 [Adiantum nelumboides]|nr:hypothetical protein [Adiantum nelumboides]